MHFSKTKMVDVGLYLLITLAVVSCTFGAAALKVPQDVFQRWSGLTGFTLVLFMQFIGNSRTLWKLHSFWTFVSAVLIIHLGALIALDRINLKTTTFYLMLSFLAEAIMLKILKRLTFGKYLASPPVS